MQEINKNAFTGCREPFSLYFREPVETFNMECLKGIRGKVDIWIGGNTFVNYKRKDPELIVGERRWTFHIPAGDSIIMTPCDSYGRTESYFGIDKSSVRTDSHKITKCMDIKEHTETEHEGRVLRGKAYEPRSIGEIIEDAYKKACSSKSSETDERSDTEERT